jgi:hypothetical protein
MRLLWTAGLLIAATLVLYWLGAYDFPIIVARWWSGGHGAIDAVRRPDAVLVKTYEESDFVLHVRVRPC